MIGEFYMKSAQYKNFTNVFKRYDHLNRGSA